MMSTSSLHYQATSVDTVTHIDDALHVTMFSLKFYFLSWNPIELPWLLQLLHNVVICPTPTLIL